MNSWLLQRQANWNALSSKQLALLLSVAFFSLLACAGSLNRLGKHFDATLRPTHTAAQLELQEPVLPMLALFAGMFACYWFAIPICLRFRSGRLLALGIVLTSAVLRAVVVPSFPILEIDYHRYLWDGAVLAEGVNPYRFAPQQVIDAADELAEDSDPPAASLPNTKLQKLVNLSRRSRSLDHSLRTIHYGTLNSPYPLVSQSVFAAAAMLTPDGASVRTRVTILKTLLTLFDLGTLFLVLGLLSLCQMHLGWAIAYGWCPLLLKEIANGGHLDSIAILYATLALFLLVRTVKVTTRPKWTSVATGVALALAIAAKIYPLVLAPLFAAVWWRRHGWQSLLLGTLTCVGITALLMAPMLRPPETSKQSRRLNQEEHAAQTGLQAFLNTWEMNDLLFMVARENLRPQNDIPLFRRPWFVVTSDKTSNSLLKRFLQTKAHLSGQELPTPASELDLQQAKIASFELARILAASLTLSLALVFAWRAAHSKQPLSSILRAAFLTLAWFWLLCPTQNPWYWCWALPLLPFARARAWHAVAALTMLYYLRFWYEAHFPSPPTIGTRYDGEHYFYFIIVWVEFGFLLLWLAENWREGLVKRLKSPASNEL